MAPILHYPLALPFQEMMLYVGGNHNHHVAWWKNGQVVPPGDTIPLAFALTSPYREMTFISPALSELVLFQ